MAEAKASSHWRYKLQIQGLKNSKDKIPKHINLEFKNSHRASLVVHQWRIHLPMQETQVRSLVWEDPTCHGATKSVSHNYWGCTLEPGSCNYWDHILKPEHPRLCSTGEAAAMRSFAPQLERSLCLLQLEKACIQQQRPRTAKNK